jgi:hypothetical protein
MAFVLPCLLFDALFVDRAVGEMKTKQLAESEWASEAPIEQADPNQKLDGWI